MSDSIISTFLGHRTQKPFAVQNRTPFKVYRVARVFVLGLEAKTKSRATQAKGKRAIRQVNSNNPQQKKLLQTQVDNYYVLPTTQRRINTLISKITRVTRVFVLGLEAKTKSRATRAKEPSGKSIQTIPNRRNFYKRK